MNETELERLRQDKQIAWGKLQAAIEDECGASIMALYHASEEADELYQQALRAMEGPNDADEDNNDDLEAESD